MMNDIKDLIDISRLYGADPDWVLAGGGNTSMKSGDEMWVKASGYSLATITEEGFVKMELPKLFAITEKKYSDDADEREAVVLEDMMAARSAGEESRPSVEALLHSLIPGRLVCHTHPTLINALTCSIDGKALTEKYYGDDAIWIPFVEPGYTLAMTIVGELAKRKEAGRKEPAFIFLENHGLFVAGENAEEIASLHKQVRAPLVKQLVTKGLKEAAIGDVQPWEPGSFGEAALKLDAKFSHYATGVSDELLKLTDTDEAFGSLDKAITPDHIVYSGPGFLRLDSADELLPKANAYKKNWGRTPQAFFIKGQGVVVIGKNEKDALTSLSLVLDGAKIQVLAAAFGGMSPMTDFFIRFILDWEVEAFRAQMALKKD